MREYLVFQLAYEAGLRIGDDIDMEEEVASTDPSGLHMSTSRSRTSSHHRHMSATPVPPLPEKALQASSSTSAVKEDKQWKETDTSLSPSPSLARSPSTTSPSSLPILPIEMPYSSPSSPHPDSLSSFPSALAGDVFVKFLMDKSEDVLLNSIVANAVRKRRESLSTIAENESDYHGIGSPHFQPSSAVGRSPSLLSLSINETSDIVTYRRGSLSYQIPPPVVEEDIHMLSFESLLRNPLGIEVFRLFSEKEYSSENILFHEAIQKVERQPVPKEQVKPTVRTIYSNFIADYGRYQITLSSATRIGIETAMDSEDCDSSCFSKAHRVVMKQLRTDVYRRFCQGSLHDSFLEELRDIVESNHRAADVHR